MIVFIASQKGGVGKTSTAISLSAGVAREGHKVLLIDMDPQANSSKVLIPDYPQIDKKDTTCAPIIHRQPIPYFPTNVPNLHIAPSNILLSEATLALTVAKDHREARLKAQIDAVRAEYDHIFGLADPQRLYASDWIVVIVSPGFFELDSLNQLGKVVEKVRECYNPDLVLSGFQFTRSESEGV